MRRVLGATRIGGTYHARDLFCGTLRGNNAPIQTPAFQGMTSKSQVDARTHELQFIGSLLEDRLNHTGGVFLFNEKTQQDNPQAYSLPIAFIVGRSPQLPPIYQATATDVGIPGYPIFLGCCAWMRVIATRWSTTRS